MKQTQMQRGDDLETKAPSACTSGFSCQLSGLTTVGNSVDTQFHLVTRDKAGLVNLIQNYLSIARKVKQIDVVSHADLFRFPRDVG